MSVLPPDNPCGPVQAVGEFDAALKLELINSLELAPNELTQAVSKLTDSQLDTRYRNWTIRQIVHHVADSHVHSYIRFKWALTEDSPTIKAYAEADWVEIEDAKHGDVLPALGMLLGLHTKWTQTLQVMSDEQFSRTFVHPETGNTVSLWEALNYYPWHSRHHTGQILWLREQNGW